MDNMTQFLDSGMGSSVWADAHQDEPNAWIRMVAGTGDVLLFSGRTWAARTVRWFTASPWSHVAIVVNDPLIFPEPLVLEATRASDLKDLLRGRRSGDGVQLVSLQEKLCSYPGRVVLRRWPGHKQRPDSEAVFRVLEEYGRRPYLDYVRRNVRQWLGLPQGQGTFCSELVVEVLKIWGLLVPERPARLYVPRHFSEQALPELGLGGVRVLKEA